MYLPSVILVCAALASTGNLAIADEARAPEDNRPGNPTHEVHMARLVYEHAPQSGWGPGRAWWRIDWPEAEQHFLAGVDRYTLLDVAPDSVHVSLMEDALFEHPWLFVQQPGRWRLSEEENTRLGEYLRRGGFMVADDFHGPGDWSVFANAMNSALPGRPIVDLEDDVLLNVHYSLDKRTQIPGRRHLFYSAEGVQVRMPFGPPRWRGIYDDDGRLMVAINFNMDTGDAWEHADDADYPVSMTSYAYRVGINYLVYALTH